MTHLLSVTILKILLSLGLILYLVFRIHFKISGRGKTSLLILMVAAAIGVSGFFNLWQFHGRGQFVHYYEMYHYYINSKYFKELGYFDLYAATVIADAESGHVLRKTKTLMDPRTYRHTSKTALLRDKTRVAALKSSFTPARWQEFKQDIRYIHRHDNRLPQMIDDHGYNATPFWTLMGYSLSNRIAIDHVHLIALLDYLLLGIMFLAVCWAFGLAKMLFVLIFWSACFFTTYFFIGGSMLRYDWLVAVMIGLCLLEKKHYGASGAFMAYGVLMRIFPLLFVFPIGLKMLMDVVRHKRIEKIYVHFFGGFTLLLIGFSLLLPILGNPADILRSYAQKIELHNRILLTNDIGLKMILLSDRTHFNNPEFTERYRQIAPRQNPFITWTEVKNKRARELKPLFWAIDLAMILVLGWIVRRKPLVEAACFGVFLLFVILAPTNYYYTFLVFLGLCLYDDERIRHPDGFFLILLLFLNITCYLLDLGVSFYLAKFLLMSCLMAMVFLVILVCESLAAVEKSAQGT